MTKLNPKGLVIEIPGPPAETWHGIFSDLIDILYSQNPDFIASHQPIYLLLQHMVLTPDQVAVPEQKD